MDQPVSLKHLEFLESVAGEDVEHIKEKEKTYQGSWKKRGGCGAFLMAARKWDRLEVMLSGGYNWDIFAAIAADPSGVDGCALAEIRDLRRYLLLIEAEMVSRGVVKYINEPPPAVGVVKSTTNKGGVLYVDMVITDPSVIELVNDPSAQVKPPSRPPMPPHVQDGLQPIDYIEVGVHYFTIFDHKIQPHYLVNRDCEPRSVWDHLPRLSVELNNKEHEETPAEYRGLYTWSGEKWVMSLMYREAWGKEP